MFLFLYNFFLMHERVAYSRIHEVGISFVVAISMINMNHVNAHKDLHSNTIDPNFPNAHPSNRTSGRLLFSAIMSLAIRLN